MKTVHVLLALCISLSVYGQRDLSGTYDLKDAYGIKIVVDGSDFSRLSGNKISVVQSSTASGNRESVGFRLKVPYKRGALSVELFEEESLIPIYRLTYTNADTVFTLPPEVRNKKLGLFIVPEKYFHVEQDGRFFGRLFYVSDCLREFVIENETDEVTVEIPDIHDLFFDTYQVENEYAQVTDDAIAWKGKTWKRASLIP